MCCKWTEGQDGSVCESFHGAVHLLFIKVLVVEEFLSSEFLLLQGLRYNIQLILCSLPAKQKHHFGSVEFDPRGVKEKRHYSFLETWPQIYRRKKTLRFWLPNLKPPEWSLPRALDLSWLEYSCRTFWSYLAQTQAAWSLGLGVHWFSCVFGILLSLAIQKALLELPYIVKDRLQKLIPDKNISFYIFLLPSSMQLCYASSDFFRILAGIQNIEESWEREEAGRPQFEPWLCCLWAGDFSEVCCCFSYSRQALVYTLANWRAFLAV